MIPDSIPTPTPAIREIDLVRLFFFTRKIILKWFTLQDVRVSAEIFSLKNSGIANIEEFWDEIPHWRDRKYPSEAFQKLIQKDEQKLFLNNHPGY